MNEEQFKKRLSNFWTLYNMYANHGRGTESLIVPFFTLLGYDCCSSDVVDYDVKSSVVWMMAGRTKERKARIQLIVSPNGVALASLENSRAFVDNHQNCDFQIVTDGVIFHVHSYGDNVHKMYTINASEFIKLMDARTFLAYLVRSDYDASSAISKMTLNFN